MTIDYQLSFQAQLFIRCWTVTSMDDVEFHYLPLETTTGKSVSCQGSEEEDGQEEQ